MTAIREGRIYEVKLEGVTQGWSFNRTGVLVIRETMDDYATQNGINPVEVLLLSGSPALNSESGAIQFATNSGAHVDAGNAQLDLTFVEQPSENVLTITVDERISASGSNLFNSTSSLHSLYQIFEGEMILGFSDDGSSVVGGIDISGTFSLQHRPASYEASISGTLVEDLGDDDSNSPSSDRFEPNNTESTATSLTSIDGIINEPDLSIHNSEDVDFFQFTLSSVGSSENFVQIDFDHALGDLDLKLYTNSNGTWQEINSSESTSNQELISLAGLETGNYLVKVYGYDEATSPDYDLITNVSGAISLPPNFDPLLYGASNPDLIQAFGYNIEAFRQHYINAGYWEGRTFNGFNPTQYLASHDDLIFAFGNNPQAALDHFIQAGYWEGRSSDNFAEDIYLASHGDLIQAFSNNLEAATQHYILAGASEGRAKALFDPVAYLNKYADLQAAFGNDLAAATQHYILAGFAEGRTYI